MTMMMSRLAESYHIKSKGQLPAVFTPYKTAVSWKGTRFDNSRLKRLGWQQITPTREALSSTFVRHTPGHGPRGNGSVTADRPTAHVPLNEHLLFGKSENYPL